MWVSFTLEDSTAACLRDKQPLVVAFQQLQGNANLAAVLVNCCAPAAVTAAVPVLKQHAPQGAVSVDMHLYQRGGVLSGLVGGLQSSMYVGDVAGVACMCDDSSDGSLKSGEQQRAAFWCF